MQWILHLDGYMEIATKWLCTKATIYWKEPTIIHQKPLLSKKKTCCVICTWEIRPLFSQWRGKYSSLFFFFLVNTRRDTDIRRVFFQQDAATCHILSKSMAFMRELFSGRFFSLWGDMECNPPRSPHLTPHIVLEKSPTLEQLSNTMTQKIQKIPTNMLKRCMKNFSIRY